MPESVKLCSHVKSDGIVCGSPAVGGTELCYHHSAVKRVLGKAQAEGPLPFVFPEDRASLQINYFILLKDYNEGRMEQATFNCLFSLLRAMARNLGRSGSLVREDRAQGSEPRAQEGGNQGSESKVQKGGGQGSGARVQKVSEVEAVFLNAAAELKPEACFSRSGSTAVKAQFDPIRVSGLSGEGRRIVEGKVSLRG
ncbi:MAG: hypothetical protein WBD10_15330 [Acidobacteriaceae bacterium]